MIQKNGAEKTLFLQHPRSRASLQSVTTAALGLIGEQAWRAFVGDLAQKASLPPGGWVQQNNAVHRWVTYLEKPDGFNSLLRNRYNGLEIMTAMGMVDQGAVPYYSGKSFLVLITRS